MISIVFHAHELAHAHDILRICNVLRPSGRYSFSIICTSEIAWDFLRANSGPKPPRLRYIPEYRGLAYNYLNRKKQKARSGSSRTSLKSRLIAKLINIFFAETPENDSPATLAPPVSRLSTVQPERVFPPKHFDIPSYYYSWSDLYRLFCLKYPVFIPWAKAVIKFLHCSRLFPRLLSRLVSSLLSNIIPRILLFTLFLQIEKWLVYRQLNQWHPQCVILTEENCPYGTGIFINYAKHKNIPVVLVPYASTPPVELARAYSRNEALHADKGWLNIMTARLFPQWVARDMGYKVLVHGLDVIWPFQLTGLAPQWPLYLQSGEADKILMESRAMYEFYRARRVKPEKMVLSGAAWSDKIRHLRDQRCLYHREACAEYGLDASRQLAVVSLPPFVPLPMCKTLQEYVPLIQTFINAALPLRERFELLICLHPRMRGVAVKGLNLKNIPIFTGNTENAIGIAGIYMACVSETIRWAVACGIPVVNFDIYNFRFMNYKNMRAVLHAYNYADAAEITRRLASDAAFFEQMSSQQQKDSGFWSGFNINFTDTLIRTIDEEIRKKQK